MKKKIIGISLALTIFVAGTTAGASGLGFAEGISAEISKQLQDYTQEVKKRVVLAESHQGSQLMTILLDYQNNEIERGKAALDAAGERRIQRLEDEGASEEDIEAEKEAIRQLTDAKISELVKEIEDYEF